VSDLKNLVHKYGLVPRTVYPDVYSATASSRLNWLITTKLREDALVLRDLISSSAGEDKILIAKAKMMEEIYGAMVIAFGRPPKPDESFNWTYTDKDGKYHRVKSTPTQFYKDSDFKAEEHFSLINDPRNEYNKLYTVDRLKNSPAPPSSPFLFVRGVLTLVSEGNGVAYVNTTLSTMKSVAIKMLKQNNPVFFGSDVGQFSNSQLGVMDTDLYDYKLGFNLSLRMTKGERIKVGSSAMTHAMVLTGVDLDGEGQPTKWRVENSWGSAAGKEGYFLMTDRWFDEYVYQVVCGFEDAPKELVEIFQRGEPVVLEAWDPMVRPP
jgi:bleomycin hydrolase